MYDDLLFSNKILRNAYLYATIAWKDRKRTFLFYNFYFI